jgi:membrane-bound serine protease (ClpP class)
MSKYGANSVSLSKLCSSQPKNMKKKLYNDTTSWMDALTSLKGHNKDFGRDIVTKAKAVDAREALRLGAIDYVSDSTEGFLKFAQGRNVKLKENKEALVVTGNLKMFDQDLKYKFLSLVTHPQVTYLMFMGSLGLLYFEITHPGLIAPGVFGALGLIISLLSFHMLNVQWTGIALLFVGIGLLIAELFVTSFGALGIGGIIAFVAGSLLLFDPGSGLSIPIGMVLATATMLLLIILGLGYLALKT